MTHLRTHAGSARARLPAVLLLVLAPAFLSAQQPPVSSDCEAPVWGAEASAFAAALAAYVDLRSGLERGLAAPAHALAVRLRAARPRARQGDLLTPALTLQIKRSLRREIDPHTWKVMMDDDNPGELPSQVNDEYRRGEPLSTMPPNILAALPRLADDIQYRFVGRHLILLDTRANLILDRIPYAVRYSDAENSCR